MSLITIMRSIDLKAFTSFIGIILYYKLVFLYRAYSVHRLRHVTFSSYVEVRIRDVSIFHDDPEIHPIFSSQQASRQSE